MDQCGVSIELHRGRERFETVEDAERAIEEAQRDGSFSRARDAMAAAEHLRQRQRAGGLARWARWNPSTTSTTPTPSSR